MEQGIPTFDKEMKPMNEATRSEKTGSCVATARRLCRGLVALILSIAWIGFGTVGAARAEEKAPPAVPREGDPVRERTIYVPYDRLQTIFEKEGRGIFLPYEKFLELWTAAQPRPPAPPPDEPPAPAVIRGGSYEGSVLGDVARFTVTYEIDALKKGWSELPLALKGVAIEGVELSSPEALFTAKGGEYALILPAPGHYQAKLRFSVRVSEEPGKRSFAFQVPPAGVSRLDVALPEEDARVDVKPTLAVTQATTKDKTTRVLAFLGNSAEVSVGWMPPLGKVVDASAVMLAEQAVRVELGERILQSTSEIVFQVMRGEVDTLRLRMPKDMRLLAVKGDNIREWAEEAGVAEEPGTLVVKLHSPLRDPSKAPPGSPAASQDGGLYRLGLSFDRILAETPPTLSVPFPSVEGAIRESGWVIFRYDPGLDVRVSATKGLSQLDRDEVPEGLRAGLGLGFRYLGQPVSLALAVERIIPTIHSSTTSLVTLGPEEDAWILWVDYQIAKAGVFRLQVKVPERWTVASAGDPAQVETWQASAVAEGVRTIVVDLKAKALGAFRLNLKLLAQGSAAAGEVSLALPVVVDSTQDRGLLGIAAPKAFGLTTVDRGKLKSADVEELFRSGILTQAGAEVGLPLTYAYRAPEGSVKVRLEAKKTEIDVLAQHLVEITDAGAKFTHILDYDVRYAAVDRLEFTAPSSLDSILKVEAKEKKELKKGSSEGGRTNWELILQAPALGGVSVTVTHEEELKALEPGKPHVLQVAIVQASGAREKRGFLALRKEGTLEVTPQPSHLESIDPADLPDKLRRGQIYGAFRYFALEPALALSLTRYEYQELATTVVNLLYFRAVVAEERKLAAQVVLLVQNTERQYLELKLSPGANILSVTVAGRSQQPRQRKEGSESRLIQIPASAGPGAAFPVVISYEESLGTEPMGAAGSLEVRTPEVLDGVPVTKLGAELYLSPEYVYLGWAGSLRPSAHDVPGPWERFKDVLGDALEIREAPGGVPVAAGQAPANPAGSGGVDIELPTRGTERRDFESLAPVGTLRFRFIGKRLFAFLDFLAFALAAAATAGVLKFTRCGRGSIFLASVGLPLVGVWFIRSPASEIFASLFAGALAVFAIRAALLSIRALRERRKARLLDEEDPFLVESPIVPAVPTVPPVRGPVSNESPPAAEGKDEPTA